MGKYHNDQPIKGGPRDPDLLNRSSFSNNLAEILLLKHDDECLTVSLEGEWGYGKTSVINLVKGALNEKEKVPIIIEYNPWLAGRPESLIQDFLLQFSSQLSININSDIALKASKELIAYSSLFSVAKLIPGAEPWASIIEKVLTASGNATKEISGLKSLDLLSKKRKVVELIKKLDTPVVVIIDDIDRLTPKETFQVLRLVKAVADFSGTSFLLAFDANYLTAVLNKNDIINSSEYINKVIQLRVPLPVISNRSLNLLADVEFQNLNYKRHTKLFQKDEERLSWVFHQYFKHLIRNPRELKRCFNHLKFVLGQVEGQVCFTDLFSLSVIASKADLVYEHIKKTPEAYIGKMFPNDTFVMEKTKNIIESFEEERNQLLVSFDEKDTKLINGLLGEIFPMIATSESSLHYVSDSDEAGRVSAFQRLYVAFHYTTPEGYISDQDIVKFITGEHERRRFLENAIEKNADERFFEMMTHYSSKCKDYSFDVITSIYDVMLESQELIDSLESNYGFTSKNIYRDMEWLSDKIISENDSKFQLLERIVNRTKNAPLSGSILYNLRDQVKANQPEEAWITDDQLAELESIFQCIAIEALTQKVFIDHHLESHLFFSLMRSSKEKSSHFISNIMEEDNGVIRVAEIIRNTGSDSINGPYVEINEEKFSTLLDISALRQKAKDVILNEQSISVQSTIKSILDGEQYYLRDGVQGTGLG